MITLEACRHANDDGATALTSLRAAIAALFFGCNAMLANVGAVKMAAILSATSDNEPGQAGENRPDSPHRTGGHGAGPQEDQGSVVPPVPDGLVGEQGDPRAGPTRSGSRYTSGPLAPRLGGVGDIQKDFDYLTEGTGKPFPDSDSRSSIPGAITGDNGIWMRPDGKGGGRIEIPGGRNKLPETLHY